MASWQFSYPYNDTDTATVLFNASPADATYQWRVPLRDAPSPRGASVRTCAGGARHYKFGTAGRLIVLTFNAIPTGSTASATALYGYAGIKEFFETHVEFNRKTFGFCDHLGSAELEVRLANGLEGWEQIEGGFWRGQIVLEKEL